MAAIYASREQNRAIYRTDVQEPCIGPGIMYQPLPQYSEYSRTSADRLASVAGSVQGPYSLVRTHGTKSPRSSPKNPWDMETTS